MTFYVVYFFCAISLSIYILSEWLLVEDRTLDYSLIGHWFVVRNCIILVWRSK